MNPISWVVIFLHLILFLHSNPWFFPVLQETDIQGHQTTTILLGIFRSSKVRYERAFTMKLLKQRHGIAGAGGRHLAELRNDRDKVGSLPTSDSLCCAHQSDPQLPGLSMALSLSSPKLGWSRINHLSPLVERNALSLHSSLSSWRPPQPAWNPAQCPTLLPVSLS